MEQFKTDLADIKTKVDKIFAVVCGDESFGEEGLIKKHNALDNHVDTEIRALNLKVDGVIDDQKKWKWIAVGFSAAGTFFGSIIGWLVDKK